MKPVTVGTPRDMLLAMKVAESWPPSAPPSVLITVFMPLATPVWWLGTACTMRLPSAAKARPMPTPSSAAATSSSQGCSWATASIRKDAVEKTRARQQRRARAEAGGDRTGLEAEDRHPDRRGQQVEAGDDDRGAEAEAGAGRQLGELGEDDEGGVEPGAEQEGGGVGGPDAAHAHHRHVDQRVVAAHLDRDPGEDEERSPTSGRPSVFAEIPSPRSVVWLIASSTAEMPIVISAAASQLTRPGRADGRFRDQAPGGDGGERRSRTSGIQNSQW